MTARMIWANPEALAVYDYLVADDEVDGILKRVSRRNLAKALKEYAELLLEHNAYSFAFVLAKSALERVDFQKISERLIAEKLTTKL